MADRIWIAEGLAALFPEVHPMDYYREIFPDGELAQKGTKEEWVKGEYQGIGVEFLPELYPNGKPKIKRHLITDDLDRLGDMLESENFIILSPISYAGRQRTAKNARFLYAMIFDLDGIEKVENLRDLLHQMLDEVDEGFWGRDYYLPTPTFIVWSGSGVHLVFVFEKPVPCYDNVVEQLSKLKRALTTLIWNGYVSEKKNPEYESLFQGFRLAGGVSKNGNRTRIFRTGERVSIDYLNEFVKEEERAYNLPYKGKITLGKAKEKWPEWYQRRVINKEPKRTWNCNPALYKWWIERLKEGAIVGHRYWCMFVLAIYGQKCGLDQETVYKDALELVPLLDQLTEDEDNHFVPEDVAAAMDVFDDDFHRFTIDAIEKLSSIHIERNKRNYRKQEIHLKIARAHKEILKAAGEPFKKLEGRPSMRNLVVEYHLNHPEAKQKDVVAALGCSLTTVKKYWKEKTIDE